MSGHSHASTIKHQKEATDKKRGTDFSKLGRAIAIAARAGVDPNTNFKLRLAIEKARQINMPKSNIERAIARGAGTSGEATLEEATYEGYGPATAAVIVEVVTDNKNRTIAEIKNLFERNGGSLAGPGSVTYQFERLGKIIIKKPSNPDEAILRIIDLGVENIDERGETIEIYTKPGELEEVATQIINTTDFIIQDKDLVLRPKTIIKIDEPQQREKVLKFIGALEDHDDVQKVSTNFDFTT